jgi:hypothetical protein
MRSSTGPVPGQPADGEMSSSTSVDLSFERGEFVILGTQ